MKINIISNIENGAGLQRDYLILRDRLTELGHTVNGVMWNQREAPSADLNISMEVISGRLLNSAPRNWFIPNTEWYYAQMWDMYIPQFQKILCKTKDALRTWARKVYTAEYLGFESLDFYDPGVERKPHFLHIAGKSETKNTAAVAQAWRDHKVPYPLTVVASKPGVQAGCMGIENLRLLHRQTDEEIIRLINECEFCLMPSKQEGWGHGIHEALACGSVVITTNAPPMNEFPGVCEELLIQPISRAPMRAAIAYFVDVNALVRKVERAMKMSPARKKHIGINARAAFLRDRDEFRARLARLMRAA